MLNFLLNTFVKAHYTASLFNRHLLIARDSYLKNVKLFSYWPSEARSCYNFTVRCFFDDIFVCMYMSSSFSKRS